MAASMSVRKLLRISLLYAALCTFVTGEYTLSKVEVKTEIDGKHMRVFSKEDIAKYDASNPDLPIYLAMRGVVFDVTSGEKFYGKESSYNILAGKDATRAHTLWSLEEKDMTHDLTGLSDSDLEHMDEIFVKTYVAKYPVVGYMDFLVAQQPEDVAQKLVKEEL